MTGWDKDSKFKMDDLGLTTTEIDMFNQLFALDPFKRASAADMCGHDYFKNWRPSFADDAERVLQPVVKPKTRAEELEAIPYRMDVDGETRIYEVQEEFSMKDDMELVQHL
jgi:hypothetical protein